MTIYKLVDLDAVLEAIDPKQDLAFDTETIGKYGKVRLAQFYQRHWDKALLVEYPSIFSLVAMLAKLKTTNIVMQYSGYDISTLQDQSGMPFIPSVFNDTFLLARLAFPHLSEYTLDSLITEAMDHDPYAEAGIDKAAMHKDKVWSTAVLEPEKLLYAAMDVYYLFCLYDKIKHAEHMLSYKIDMRALKRALDFQRNGFPVSQDRVERLYRNNLKQLDILAMPINVNSYKQVRPYIGSDSSDDLGLARLSMFGNERATNVRLARKLLKQNSFLDKFITDDGKIYGHFMPSARSGRFTCDSQNLQQLPRATKSCFGVPDGRVLLYSDYAQLELRTIAAITGDRNLCNYFYHKIDPHGAVAEGFFGSDYTKDNRQTTKTINFNALYGGGAKMLQGILLKQAEQWHEEDAVVKYIRKWKRMFPGIVKWQEQGIRDYRAGRLGSTPFGRQYVGRMMTDQLNIENQGFGADVAKLAMHYMYDDMVELGGVMTNFIHDSYLVECDDDPAIYKPLAAVMAEAMKEAWLEASKMAKITDIPMPVQVRVGYNWGDIEKDEYIYQLEI